MSWWMNEGHGGGEAASSILSPHKTRLGAGAGDLDSWRLGELAHFDAMSRLIVRGGDTQLGQAVDRHGTPSSMPRGH